MSAHADTVYQGNDFARVSSDHRYGKVCDEEADGHAVWGIWYLDTGEEYAAYDNGSDGVCTDTERFPGDAVKFAVCDEYKGCRTART